MTFVVSCQIVVAKLIKLSLLDWQQLISISEPQALPPTQATPRSRTSKTQLLATPPQILFNSKCVILDGVVTKELNLQAIVWIITITQHSVINELERSVASNRSTEARRSSNAHATQILWNSIGQPVAGSCESL